jgi:hypothetical protein
MGWGRATRERRACRVSKIIAAVYEEQRCSTRDIDKVFFYALNQLLEDFIEGDSDRRAELTKRLSALVALTVPDACGELESFVDLLKSGSDNPGNIEDILQSGYLRSRKGA